MSMLQAFKEHNTAFHTDEKKKKISDFGKYDVFALVSAAFTNIYITQPVLPILQKEFSVDMVLVYFTWRGYG